MQRVVEAGGENQPWQEALEEYAPTACDFLTMAGELGRSTASSLHKVPVGFSGCLL